MFQLRYYAPHYDKKVHEEIINLLNQIKEKHSIEHQIIQLRAKKSEYNDDYYVDESHEKEIYESDFKPRAKVLKVRVGESIRRIIRSRSGGYFIAGTVAIIKNNQVEWLASYYSDRFKNYHEDSKIGFLKAVLDRGVPLLQELCPLIKALAKFESSLLDKFIESGVLKGDFKREVKVGRKIFPMANKGKEVIFDWRKSIDAICITENSVWILEAKRKLNYEALGEVLTYSHLYEREHPNKEIRMGIICGEVEDEILETCRKLNIKVFEITGEEVRQF